MIEAAFRFETGTATNGGARVRVTIPFRVARPASDTRDLALAGSVDR